MRVFLRSRPNLSCFVILLLADSSTYGHQNEKEENVEESSSSNQMNLCSFASRCRHFIVSRASLEIPVIGICETHRCGHLRCKTQLKTRIEKGCAGCTPIGRSKLERKS